jgi:PKD repeat protein
MKSKSVLLSICALLGFMISSCENTPAPTAEIFATIDGYKVTFEPTVTDTKSYLWDFGDGKSSTEEKPLHTYEMSGSYNVTLTVNGDGGTGTANKEVVITPSFTEMLTGGPAATNGKTWVLTTAYSASQDGGGPVLNSMPIMQPSAENVLNMFGLGAEYDNEFTFYSNGTYKMNPKNGKTLAGAVYGAVTETMQGDPAYAIGMCSATFTAPASSSWTYGTADFTVDAITDPNTSAVPPVHGNVTFTGKKWISLSTGAYFGILDFPATPRFIIKEITPSKMNVAIFLCGYGYGADLNMMLLPTNLIHITFIPKAK